MLLCSCILCIFCMPCIFCCIPLLPRGCILFCRPALLGGFMLFCSPALLGGCDVDPRRCCGPGEAFIWACWPLQPGYNSCSFVYSSANAGGEAGTVIIAGPGWMAWLGLWCFSAFCARKERFDCNRRMQLGGWLVCKQGYSRSEGLTRRIPSQAAAAACRPLAAWAQCVLLSLGIAAPRLPE
jgi:hypothetical protein